MPWPTGVPFTCQVIDTLLGIEDLTVTIHYDGTHDMSEKTPHCEISITTRNQTALGPQTISKFGLKALTTHKYETSSLPWDVTRKFLEDYNKAELVADGNHIASGKRNNKTFELVTRST